MPEISDNLLDVTTWLLTLHDFFFPFEKIFWAFSEAWYKRKDRIIMQIALFFQN